MRGKITRTFLTTKFSIAPLQVLYGVPSFNMALKEDHEIDGGYSEEELAAVFPRILKKKGMWGVVDYEGVISERYSMDVEVFKAHAIVELVEEDNE